MTVVTTLLLSCLAVTVCHAELDCVNSVSCQCGSTEKNVTLCADAGADVCAQLSKCKSCEEGSHICSECPEGFKGPLCSQDDRKYCTYRNPIPNGKISYSHPTQVLFPEMKPPLNTTLNYTCDEGYFLDGKSSVTCRNCFTYKCSGATWSWSEEPTCKTDCGRGFFNYGPCYMMDCNMHTPWVVFISIQDENGFNTICLGSLLNHNTVLTAAHCLIPEKNFTIHFNKHKFGDGNPPNVIVRKSSRILVHPDFSNTTFDSNIGLLFFEPKIRFTADVQPICLREAWQKDEDTIPGKTGIISVTGLSHKDVPAGDMKLSRMTVLSDEECLKINRQANLFITKNSFCAGNKDDLQKVCGLDSGAPLFFYDKNEGRFVLGAIVSYGRKRRLCGLQGNYAIFTKVQDFLKWIKNNLQ